MSIFSTLFKTPTPTNVQADREKRMRRRRFLEALNDRSRSMRMEHLEPRLLLAADFIDTGALEIYRDGGFTGAVPTVDSGAFTESGSFLVAKKGGSRIVRVDNAVLDFDGVDVLEFTPLGLGGTSVPGKGGGTNWELLTTGSWIIKTDSLQTESVDAAAGDGDYLEFGIFEFDTTSFGFTDNALTVQGSYELAGTPGLLAPFTYVGGGASGFDIDGSNYWRLGNSGKLLTTDTSLTIPDIAFPLIPGMSGPSDPQVTLESPQISYVASEDVFRFAGKLEIENLWNGITIHGDFLGDSDDPKYAQLSQTMAGGLRVDTVGTISLEPFEVGTGDKAISIGGDLEIDTITDEYTGSLTVESEALGEFSGVATFSGGQVESVAASYAKQWALGNTGVFFQQAFLGLDDIDGTMDLFVGVEATLGPAISVEIPAIIAGTDDPLDADFSPATMSLAGSTTLTNFCSVSTSMTPPATFEEWFEGKPQTTGFDLLTAEIDDEQWSLVTGSLDATYDWCAGVIDGDATVDIGDGLVTGTLNANITLEPQLGIELEGSASVNLSRFDSWLPDLNGDVVVQYNGNDKDHIAAYGEWWGGDYGFVYWLESGEYQPIIHGSYAGSLMEGEHDIGETNEHGHWSYDTESWDQLLFAVTWDNLANVADIEDRLELVDDNSNVYSIDPTDPNSDFQITRINPASVPDGTEEFHAFKIESINPSFNINQDWTLRYVPSGVTRENFNFTSAGLWDNINASITQLDVASIGGGDYQVDYEVVVPDSTFRIEFYGEHQDNGGRFLLNTVEDISLDSFVIDGSSIPSGTYDLIAILHDTPNSPLLWAPLPQTATVPFVVGNDPPAFDLEASGDLFSPTPNDDLNVILEGNQYFQFTVVADDIDGDPLTYSLVSPPSTVGIDSNTGLVTIVRDYTRLGPYTEAFTVRVSDDSGATSDLDVKADIIPGGLQPADIIQALNLVGHKIQDVASQITVPDGIPFVSEAYSQTVSFTDTFLQTTTALFDDPALPLIRSNDVTPYDYSAPGQDATFYVQLDSKTAYKLELDANINNAAELIDELNEALENAGAIEFPGVPGLEAPILEAVEEEIDSEDWVVIRPVNKAIYDQLLFSNFYVESNVLETVAPDGVLQNDLELQVSLEHGEPGTLDQVDFTITLTTAETASNEGFEDLLEQLQVKLPALGIGTNQANPLRFELLEEAGGDHRIVLLGTSKSAVVELELLNNTGPVHLFDDTTGPIEESDFNNPHEFESQLAHYKFTFNTVQELVDQINDFLADDPDIPPSPNPENIPDDFHLVCPGTSSECLTLSYDQNTHELLFEFHLEETWSNSVPLDFTNPIDIGGLGTVEIVGSGTVDVQLTAELDTAIGIDMTPGGRLMPLGHGTLLSELHNYDGLRIDASLEADQVPPDFNPAPFNLPLRLYGSFSTPPDPDVFTVPITTSGNSSIEMMAEDVDTSIKSFFEDTIYEGKLRVAAGQNGFLVLTNTDASINKIELGTAFTTASVPELGFNTNLSSQHIDLTVRVHDDLLHETQVIADPLLPTVLTESPVYGTNPYRITVNWDDPVALTSGVLAPTLYAVTYDDMSSDYSLNLLFPDVDLDYSVEYDYLNPADPLPVKNFEITLDDALTLGDVIDAMHDSVADDGSGDLLSEFASVNLNTFRGLELESEFSFEIIEPDALFDDLEPIMGEGGAEGNGTLSTIDALGLSGSVYQSVPTLDQLNPEYIEIRGGYRLDGASLDKRPLHHRVWVREDSETDPTVSLHAELEIDDANITASWGIIEAVGELCLYADAESKVWWTDPAYRQADGKLYLDELSNSPVKDWFDADWLSLNVSDCNHTPGVDNIGTDGGAAELDMDLSVLGNSLVNFNATASTDAGKEIGEPGWFNWDVSVTKTGSVNGFAQGLTVDAVIQAVHNGVDFLQEKAASSEPGWDWLNEDLPLANRSVADGLDFLDDVLDKIDQWVYQVDTGELSTLTAELKSLAHDLPDNATDEFGDEFEIKAKIKDKVGVAIDFLENAVNVDPERLLSRVIVSSSFLQSLVGERVSPTDSNSFDLGELVPELVDKPNPLDGKNYKWGFDTTGDGNKDDFYEIDENSTIALMFKDLQEKAQEIKKSIPSMANLIENLGPLLESELCEAVYDAQQCDVDNPFHVDLQLGDVDSDSINDTMLLGLRFDPQGPLYFERFTPHIDVANYGPIEVDVDGDVALTIDGFIQLSMGVTSADTGLEFFLITDGNAPIAPTAVQFNASVLGEVGASVGFGALSALSGQIGLSIAEAAVEEHTVNAGQITLSTAPVPSDNGYYLFIYDASGTSLIEPEEYEVSGSTVTFNGTGYSTVTAIYNTQEIEPPTVIAGGLAVGAKSDPFAPQGGTAAKIHLVQASTMEVVDEADYELVDDGGIKVKAIADLSDGDLYLSYMPEIIIQTNTINLPVGQQTIDFPPGPLSPLFGSNRNLGGGTPDEVVTVTDTTANDPAGFEISAVPDVSYPGGYRYQLTIDNDDYNPSLSYDVFYPTQQTFFDGSGPASLYFDLNNPKYLHDPGSTPDLNPFGGVKISELNEYQPNLISSVFATASVDAEILGSAQPDVAYAAGMIVGDSPEIDETQFEFRAGIDADALNNMLSNIDFNLKTIIQGLEAFLELLETGLKEETLAKLPLIDANDLDNAAEFVNELRTGFVEPIRERLCQAGGQPLSVIEGELAAWIFSALGPGLESVNDEADGFKSLFKDLALGNGEPDWLIKNGLGLIKMEDFRFSDNGALTVGQIEALPVFSSGNEIQDFIKDEVRVGQSYVYKRLGDDWLKVTITQDDHYAFFKAITPVTFGEDGDKFEIGDIGYVDGAELVGGGAARIGNVPLGKLYEFDVNFDHGLQGLPFDVEGDPKLEIDLDLGFDLGVGVDKDSGFYFITNDTSGAHQDEELEVSLDIGFPEDFAMGIDLFGLTLLAADNGTGLTTDFTVDISDFNADNHLTFNEIGSHSFADWFVPELTAEAALDITLSAEINSNIPSISADLRAGLGFSLVVENGEIETEFSTTALGFYDVQLDLGDFLSKTIGPILKKVDSVLDPVKPIVDFLKMEIPGISDASKIAGNGPVLVMDLAFSKNPEMGEKARQFVGIVQQIIDVVEMLAEFEEGESMAISFGDFAFGQAGTSGEDINLLEEPFPTNLGSTLDDVYNETGGKSAAEVTEQANSGSNAKVSAGFAKIDEDPGPLGLAGLGIQLDIIKDPMNIVKLLTGQTANLVSWDIPRFDLIFEYSQDFPVIPVPPISLGIGADFGLFADFSVGMDTRFKQTGNFLDGFYFGDLEDVYTGPDIPELGITIGAQLRAALDLLIVKAGVEGELRANIDANWADTNADGKMYLDEMAQIIRQDGLDCLFDISGELRALVNLFYEVDVWFWSTSGEINIVDVLLYEFELQNCPKFELAHVSENGEVEFETPGGEVLTSGTDWLIVHAGEFGDMRGGSSSDTHEYYELHYAGGPEPELTIEFNYGDLQQSFTSELTGVDTIYFSGGNGADTLKLSGDWPSDMSILFDGGNSSDTLELDPSDYTIAAGSPSLIAAGGSGDDALLVSAGTVAWELWGESGQDTIEGSSAGDAIFGGADGDVIKAGAGSDLIDAGSGNDIVYAFDPALNNADADYVFGGSGDDQIWTGQGADEIDAGPGNDLVYAGAGDDLIYGAAGNDDLYGEAGADTILGGSGNDDISGWVVVDASLETRPELASDYSEVAVAPLTSDAAGMLFAPASPPAFLGSDGVDQIAGQDGDDVILGYDGADLLAGGAGNDFIIGHEGGNDEQLFGGFGDDILIAHLLGNVDSTDNHQLYGGPDDDYFCGTQGDDTIYGGTLIDATTTVNNGGVVSLKPILSSTLFSSVAATYAGKPWSASYPQQDYEILPVDLENPPNTTGAILDKPVCHVVVLDGSVVIPEVPEAPDPTTNNSITGFVYLDANKDGIRGEDESGLAEIIVQLQDVDGEVVLETLSGEGGSYGFDNVDLGEYSVVQVLDASGIYRQSSPPVGEVTTDFYEIVVEQDDQSFESLDFGNELAGVKIEGRKLKLDEPHRHLVESYWFNQEVATHANDDPSDDFDPVAELMSNTGLPGGANVPDAGGINNWQIFLYDTEWNLLDSTYTQSIDRNGKNGIEPDEVGWYEFDHLPYGTYIVSEQYRPGWAQVLPPLYFDNAITPVQDDGYSRTNSYAQVSQLSGIPGRIDLELNLHHDNVGELHMWLEAPGNGVDPGPRIPLTWQSQRDIQDRRTAEYRGYGFGVEQGDLLDLQDPGSTIFTTEQGATDIETAGALGATDVTSSGLSGEFTTDPTDPDVLPFSHLLNLGSATAYEGQWRLIIEDVEEGNAGELLDWTLHFHAEEGQETQVHSFPGGVNRNPIQSAGVRTSYVVDMSLPEETATGAAGSEGDGSISLLPLPEYYHFGNYELVGDITGTKWHDIDGDGKRGDREPGIAGVTIYLDLNDNGRWDYTDANGNGKWDEAPAEEHEPFVITNSQGHYSFTDVPIGDYTVREHAPDHWQTSPLLLYSENFEGKPNTDFGATWTSDTASSSLLQPHLAPSGVTSFLGDFENDTIQLQLENLPAHQDLRVSFDLYVLGSWDGDHEFQGRDRFRFSADGNPYLIDTSFSNYNDRVASWQNRKNPLDVEVRDTPGNITRRDSQLVFDYVARNGAVDLSVADTGAVSTQGFLDVNGDGFISPADVLQVMNQVKLAEAEGKSNGQAKGRPPQYTFEQSYGLDATGQPVLRSDDGQFPPRTGAQRAVDFGNQSTHRPLPLELVDGTAAHNTLGYDMYGRRVQQSTNPILPADTTYHFEIDINHDSPNLNLIFAGLGLTNNGKTNFEKWGIDNIRILKDHHVVTVEAGQAVEGVDFGNQDLPDNVVTGTKYRRFEGRDYPGPGVFVYADVNDNAQWDADEPNDVTGKNGEYQLKGIRTNSVTIREIPNEGWGPLEPGTDEIDVEFKDGNQQHGVDFYNGPFTTISGVKWNDLNANGRRELQENVLAGVTVGLDLDNDGTIDRTTKTSNHGRYEFEGVAPGEHRVVELVPLGWTPVSPATGEHVVVAQIGVDLPAVHFGNRREPVVSGTKFIRRQDDGQDIYVPAAGFTIYADINNNMQWDAGEPNTKTLPDNPATPDVNELGTYRLSGFGDHDTVVIRELESPGWQWVDPQDGKHVVDLTNGLNFGDRNFVNQATGKVSGYKWNDLDGDGKWSSDEPPLDKWQIGVDLDGDKNPDMVATTNAYGYYEAIVPAGPVSVSEFTQNGWQQTHPDIQSYQVTVKPGMHVQDLNFGNWEEQEPEGVTRRFIGSVYHDKVVDGKLDPASDLPLANWKVFADLDNDQKPGSTEPTAISKADGSFEIAFDTGKLESVSIGIITESGWITTVPQEGFHKITVTGGDVFKDINFLNVPSGSISGIKWNDLDGDGQRDSNEPGLADWKILLDVGQDGTIDHTALTNSDGKYVFTGLDAGHYLVSEVQQNGWKQTFPSKNAHGVTLDVGQHAVDINFGNHHTESSTGSISGTKWNDLDGDGVRDSNEPGLAEWIIQLDAGRDGSVEKTATTDASGNYKFSDLPAGDYQVFEKQQNGWKQTFPVEDSHTVTLIAGQNVTDIHFGNQQNCEVRGRKTGLGGETGIPGVQIYADINKNGRHDPGEPATLTSFDDPDTNLDESGTYVITGLPCDPVTIRETLPTGWDVVSPDIGQYDINFDKQSVVTNLNFVNQKSGMIYGYKRYDSDAEVAGLFGADGTLDKGLDGWFIQIDYHWSANSTFVADATATTKSDDPNTPQDEEGLYVFENVPAGTHLVREVLQPGWTQTYPEPDAKSGGRNYLVHIDGSEVKGSYDFGNQSDLTVHGTKLNYEDTTEGLAGFVIYADSNNNGILDEGEVSTTTASDGSYTLTGIDQNHVHIREVQQEDYLQKDPEDSYELTFNKQTTFSGIDFLNQPVLLVPDGDDEIHIFGGDDHVFGDNEIDKTDPDFDKFISTGTRSDTYVIEQVLAKDGTAPASIADESDQLYDYLDEGNDTVTFETLYNYYGYGGGGLAGIVGPSVQFDLSLALSSPHPIAGGHTRTILFDNSDDNHIEVIVGSTEDDHLIGNGRSQTFVGHLGSDTLEGADGDDTYKLVNNFDAPATVSGITGITGVTLEPVVSGPETDVILEALLKGEDELNLAALESWSDILVDLPTASGEHELIDGSHKRTLDFQADQSLEVFVTGIVTNATVTGNAESQTFIGGGAGTTIFNGGAGADSFIINPEAVGGVIQVDGGADSDSVDLSQLDSDFVHEMNGISSSSESPDGTVMTFTEVEVLSGSQGDDYVKFIDNFGIAPTYGLIHGNGGLNTLDYDLFPVNITVDLGLGTATGTSGANQFQDVIGSKFDDTLIGSDLANRIVGNTGSDILLGGGGADRYEFHDDGDGTELDQLTDSSFWPGSRNVIDISAATTDVDVTVAGVNATIQQSGRREISVFDIENIGELRTGSGEDSIELWDTATTGFFIPFFIPLGGGVTHHFDDGLRVAGGSGDDTYIVPGSFSTEVGIVEEFDLWDTMTSSVIPGGVDTLDFTAKLGSTRVSLNEFTAVDSSSGYAVRLYNSNPIVSPFTDVVDYTGFSLFENVLTGSGDDVVFGNDNDNLIDSGNGSDVVYGLAGADEIVVHGANGEENLFAGGAGDDRYILQGDFSSGPNNRIFEAGASMTPGTGNLTPGGKDTLDLDALGSNCVYVNLQSDDSEQVTDCHGDLTAIAAGTVGIASAGGAYQEVLSLHSELMPLIDFDSLHTINDVQAEIVALGDIYNSNGRFIENVLGTTTGENMMWANQADNILTGGALDDTFVAIRGGDHFIYGAEGDDSMLAGPTGFINQLNSNGKGIAFDADGVLPAADLDGVIVIVGDFDSSEFHAYEFDNDGNTSWFGLQPLLIGEYPTAFEIEQVELGDAVFDEDQQLGYAIGQLQDAIHNDFSRYDADPLTPDPAVNVVGTGLGLPGEGVGVFVIAGVANSVRSYDLDHLYEHQAGKRVIGNNVLIGGEGQDSIISHDGSDFILADQTGLSLLATLSTSEKIDFIRDFHDIWRADDDSAENRLDELLDYLNTETGNTHASLNDYMTDDGDVDTVRLDSKYEIDLPAEEWSKGVDVFFGTIAQDQILDSDDMTPEEDDLVNDGF